MTIKHSSTFLLEGLRRGSFKQNFQVFANDYLYFAYLLLGTLQHNSFLGLANLGIQDWTT